MKKKRYILQESRKKQAHNEVIGKKKATENTQYNKTYVPYY